jgi:hypothetical protein
MLAFDTETALIREAKLAPELACLTFSDGVGEDIIHWTEAEQIAGDLLEREVTTANGSYDLAVLWAAYPELKDLIWEGLVAGRYHDILLRQALMDIGAGCYRRVYRRLPGADKPTLLRYSLSDLHARYYGQSMEKDEWRLRYGELRPLPLSQWPQGAIKYATYDAVATARIHDLQDAAAIEQGRTHNLWDEPAQMRAAFALHLASCWGFRTDLRQVEKVIGQIDNEQPTLARKLLSVGLVRKKGDEYTRSEKMAKAMMYAAVGDAGELTDVGYKKVKAGLLTKAQGLAQGYIRIDEEWCEVSGDQNLIAYYQFRQNQLLRAKLTHIQTAAFHSLPIQTSFTTLMETGRTSSSENKLIKNSMALQNPPRKGGMRECFVARPGCTLIACDYGQAELVALAQITYAAFGHSKMRDLINAGMDLHVDFAKEILAIETGRKMSYEEAWALHKAKDSTMRARRTLSKGFNFGKPGGLGAASFQSYVRKAWGVTLTFEQSKSLGYAWLKHFPEMREYFAWISSLVEVGGGRTDVQQYFSGRWRGRCFYTQAANTLFQGLTADAAKAAFFEVSRHCYTVRSSALYGCRPLLFLHDEVICEAPIAQASEAAVEMERLMVGVYQKYTPDVKIGADAHLMDRWSKDAEATHDERGKLVPWNPPQDADEIFEDFQYASVS